MEESIYQENILDHNRHPHNKRALKDFDIKQRAENPSCGDELTLYMRFDGKKVTDASFDGDGCAISQASASMFTDKLKKMEISDVKLLTPGDIYNMLGINISPSRVNCALLVYSALSHGISNMKNDVRN